MCDGIRGTVDGERWITILVIVPIYTGIATLMLCDGDQHCGFYAMYAQLIGVGIHSSPCDEIDVVSSVIVCKVHGRDVQRRVDCRVIVRNGGRSYEKGVGGVERGVK